MHEPDSVVSDASAVQLVDIAKRLEDLGVPFPPVPKELVETLTPVSDLAFGSNQRTAPLYHLERHVEALLSDWPEDYLQFGVGGHGVNSQAVHYYLVTAQCAVFVQRALPFLSSSSFQTDVFARLMEQAAELSCHPALDNFQGKLVVVDSDLLYGRIGKWQNGQLKWLHETANPVHHARSTL